jgi:glycosyltransferase involved in cell wall biosynthesis
MRILVAHNVPSARNGGMSRIMGLIHDRIAAAGHEVRYLCAEDVPPALRGRAARWVFPLLVRRAVARAAREGRPYDIVNVHEPASAAVTFGRAALGRPAVVVTSHGVEERGWEMAAEDRRLGRPGSPGLATRVLFPLLTGPQCRIGLRRADHVFCLNSQDRAFLRGRYGIPAARITRIGPGADPVFAAAAPRRDYSSARRLLFAGTWLPRKGNDIMAAAFASLAAARPGLTLTVLGPGFPQETVRASFPEPLRGRVDCVRPASDAESAAAYAAADVYILPSLFEGTPLTLIEAMAGGLPVVTTAVCGMRDVIRDGENGLLVPPRSPETLSAAVGRLLDDADLRRPLGRAAAAEAAAGHTWDRAAEPVAAAYSRLADRRR